MWMMLLNLRCSVQVESRKLICISNHLRLRFLSEVKFRGDQKVSHDFGH